jgi:hypothetical protein
MAKGFTSWTVLPHKSWVHHEENLWSLEGTLPRGGLARRMTVVRLTDGRLVIHSAVAMDDLSRAAMEAWGTPSVMIVTNRFHRLDARPFKDRWPGLQIIAPPAAAEHVRDVVPVDGGLELLPRDPALSGELLGGTAEREGVYIVRSGAAGERATLLFNDALFNLGPGKGFAGFVTRLIGSAPGPRVTTVGRWLLFKDLAAGRAHYERLASTPGLCRILVSHGRVIEENAAEVLRSVARTM